MTKTEQAALVGFAQKLQERAEKADREYKIHSDHFRRAFCDGQAHAFGLTASELWDILGMEPAS